MKVIFLDIDGVLNNSHRFNQLIDLYGDQIDRELLKIFRPTILTTGAKVVISSSWRHYDSAMQRIYDAFEEASLSGTIIGQTRFDFDAIMPRSAQI